MKYRIRAESRSASDWIRVQRKGWFLWHTVAKFLHYEHQKAKEYLQEIKKLEELEL